MGSKLRNWLLGAMALAIFILGVPLAQRVVASTNATPASSEKAVESEAPAAESEKKTGHPSVVKVGDDYVQIVPGKDGSVSALLYDSSYRLLGGNENETTLTFPLPSGDKKIVKVTAQALACPMGGEQSSSKSGDCCAAAAGGPHPESCPQKATSDKAAANK